MSNEITLTGTLQYANPAQNIPPISLALSSTNFSITGKNFEEGTKLFPTTAGGTAIPLGGIGTLGLCAFKNNDPTNYVQILSAVSGTVIIRINPGELHIFRFDPTVVAPAILANTAGVLVQYLLLEN